MGVVGEFIYGLDLSLANTGITIFELTTSKFVYIGSINTEKIKKKKDLYHNALKLKYIYDALSELKEKYPPKVVAIERGFSRFNTSTQVTYRVHGLINFLFHDINQIYYPPKTVKEAILKGDATKKQIQKVIKDKYPEIQFKNEGKNDSFDESDSFAVCLTHLIKENLIKYDKPKLPKRKATKKKN